MREENSWRVIRRNLRSPRAWGITLLSIAGVWIITYLLTNDVKAAWVVTGGFVLLGFFGALIT